MKANHGRPIKCVTNFHELRVNQASAGIGPSIFKYAVKIEPEVAVTGKLTGKIIKGCKVQLNEKFQFYLAH